MSDRVSYQDIDAILVEDHAALETDRAGVDGAEIVEREGGVLVADPKDAHLPHFVVPCGALDVVHGKMGEAEITNTCFAAMRRESCFAIFKAWPTAARGHRSGGAIFGSSSGSSGR